MGLNIRFPIGLMFVILGLLLTGYGLISDKAIYARSLGININEYWGVVMLVFGLIMLALGWRETSIVESTKDSQPGEQAH